MKHILGADVGGSKTHVAIAAADGRILSDTQTMGTIYTDAGMPEVMRVLKEAVDICLKEANIRINDINIGVFGMTGIDWPFEEKLHGKALANKFTKIDDIITCNDALVALHAGTKKDWGAILCSGTGFNAAAISPNGGSFIFGFYEDAPHCGGKSLGRKIIKAVCDSNAGLLPKTLLTDIVLDHFSVQNTDELLVKFVEGKCRRDMLTSLPTKLFRCYDKHDEVSIYLVNNMLDELSAHAVAALKKLNMENMNPDIAISGGMLKSAPEDILGKLSSRIKKEIPSFNLYYSRYEPVLGALKMGMNHLGCEPYRITNLYASAEKLATMLRTV